MATPTIDANLGQTVDQGDKFTITTTELTAHEPMGEPFFYRIKVLPASGVLKRKGVPFTQPLEMFTQEEIDAGWISYEHDGLSTTLDSFTFELSDMEAEPNVSAETTFDITIANPNSGYLLTLASVGHAAILAKFSRKAHAEAYKTAWELAHNGTCTMQTLPEADTNFTFVTMNQVDINHHLVDADTYLKTEQIKSAAGLILSTLQTRHPDNKGHLALVKEYGRRLEEDSVVTKYVLGDAEWDTLRNIGLANVSNLYHNWVAVLDLVQAQLKGIPTL